MTPNQMLRAIRALEARLDKLEANAVLEPIATRVKRAYNRKNPNDLESPENAKTNRRTVD